LREWMRRILPGPREGIVISDLDIGIRRYGPNYDLDGEGDLMLMEKKEFMGQITGGQRRIYNWIDARLNKDIRWRGWHLLKIDYLGNSKVCNQCKQPMETADEAFMRFISAQLQYGGKRISHDELRDIIEGIKK
jgi:hypothetical protein